MDMSQLAEFEAILDCLQRPDASPQQRHSAQSFALSLQNPVDLSQVPQEGDASTRRQAAVAKRLAQLQHVLDHSSSSTARVVACNSLSALATNHWDNKTLPHLEIRNYCLSFLFAQSADTTVPAYVSRAMTRLLSRVTKLGWLECEAHRGIVKQLERFFDASARHYATGLTILHDLVEEMDLPATSRRGVILRRQFLLQSLSKAFSISIDTLLSISSMADAAQAAVLGDAALQLAIRCLSFDFYGQASPGEESDDVTINVPMSWRQDLNNPRLVDLLWSFYQDSTPPQSSRALELLLLYTSVPRSVYERPDMRRDIGRRHLEGMRVVLETGVGLHHSDNYHMFCRMMGTLKDLSPLTEGCESLKDYNSWVGLAANFTRRALHDVHLPPNNLHYLLGTWGRLATHHAAPTRTAGHNTVLARIVALQSGQLNSEDFDEDDAGTGTGAQAEAVQVGCRGFRF